MPRRYQYYDWKFPITPVIMTTANVLYHGRRAAARRALLCCRCAAVLPRYLAMLLRYRSHLISATLAQHRASRKTCTGTLTRAAAVCTARTTGIVMGAIGISVSGVAMYGDSNADGADVRWPHSRASPGRQPPCAPRLHPRAGARPALTARSLPDAPPPQAYVSEGATFNTCGGHADMSGARAAAAAAAVGCRRPLLRHFAAAHIADHCHPPPTPGVCQASIITTQR